MPTFFTRNLSDLIKKLLRSQQGKRLGNTRGGTAAVVKHKWFSSFDWAALENGEAKAPHIPTVTGKDDVTNFDKFDDGEQPVSFYTLFFSFCKLLIVFIYVF
jgi:protein kinase A